MARGALRLATISARIAPAPPPRPLGARPPGRTRDNRRIFRKQQLAAVSAYRRDPDPDSVTPGVRGTYAPDITQMVWNRRAQDKAGPLIRWSEATIAADPVLRSAHRAERVAYFARLMPIPASTVQKRT